MSWRKKVAGLTAGAATMITGCGDQLEKPDSTAKISQTDADGKNFKEVRVSDLEREIDSRKNNAEYSFFIERIKREIDRAFSAIILDGASEVDLSDQAYFIDKDVQLLAQKDNKAAHSVFSDILLAIKDLSAGNCYGDKTVEGLYKNSTVYFTRKAREEDTTFREEERKLLHDVALGVYKEYAQVMQQNGIKKPENVGRSSFFY